MLILTRKLGESIIIDKNIEVNIFEIKGNQVRIGVEAPKNITVDREEIHNKKLQTKLSESITVDRKETHNKKSQTKSSKGFIGKMISKFKTR